MNTLTPLLYLCPHKGVPLSESHTGVLLDRKISGTNNALGDFCGDA